VASARSELQKAQNTLSQQERDLTSHQEDLTKDYGPDEVFRSLKGQCITTDAGEYTYELCFLDQAKQRSRKGGSDTNMGNFVSFDIVDVDDELPANGKGLGSGPRTAMRHENGQGCWNGPSRSTLVVLGCHEENEIWKIQEEEKCVYRMEVGSPAVCERKPAAKAASPEKDEL
jgi:protein kinase C substrate 80K-H